MDGPPPGVHHERSVRDQRTEGNLSSMPIAIHPTLAAFLLGSVLLAAACLGHQSGRTEAAPPAGVSQPAVFAPGEGEKLLMYDGRHVVLKTTREATGASQLFVGTEALPPGTSIPVHSHDGYEEVIFIHEGQAVLTLGEQTFAAGPATTLFIPAGTWHGVASSGEDKATMLFIFPNLEMADFFRTVGFAEGEAPPDLSGEDWARILEKHGMRARPD